MLPAKSLTDKAARQHVSCPTFHSQPKTFFGCSDYASIAMLTSSNQHESSLEIHADLHWSFQQTSQW